MNKPTDEVARAISSLENNPMFVELVQWIKDSLIDQSIKNNNNKGEDTIKMQGRNLELEELVKHIENATTYVQNATKARKMDKRGTI
jgi:hypothetical protein